MKRDLVQLSSNIYDLLIIGGGIYGSCVAWDAALRGLSVALVEKADFVSATSANSLKIIHGGLRYLQHADIRRMRESINEQRSLMRIAPHLVHPLPVLIPTYGYWTQGKELLYLALMIKELVGFRGNSLDDPQKHIPRGRMISRRDVISLLPGINQQGLTGGVIFYDAQVYNSERLPIAFLLSAKKAGAHLANYVEVTGFLMNGDCVTGVKVKDALTEDRFDIRARTVVNAGGPWVNRIMSFLSGYRTYHKVSFAKAINLVTRPLFQEYAVGISGKNRYHDSDSMINRGASLLFIAPWRRHSLIGTSYANYDGDPGSFKVTEEDIQNFLDEINGTYPSANLTIEDVLFIHGGLLPSSGICQRMEDVQLIKQYQINDYRDEGVKGLISVVGVKYTTARHVAEKVVNRVFELWGQKPPKSVTSFVPLYGGEIKRFDSFLQTEIQKGQYGLDKKEIRSLIYNYGSAYPEVLRYFDRCNNGNETLTDHFALLKAKVLYGVRDEMAQKLTDVVLRRTDLGTIGHPGDDTISLCAETMGKEMGWSYERVKEEVGEVNETFNIHHEVVR